MCFNDLLLPSMSFFECLDGVFYDIPLSSMCIREGLQKKYKTSDFAEQGRGALRITPCGLSLGVEIPFVCLSIGPFVCYCLSLTSLLPKWWLI